MAKGGDTLMRKRNKTNRKRMRNSESSVSARVAAVIAAKRRRKAGKRRICEGMCYSLPTSDDPFNDRHGKKAKEKPTPRKSDSPSRPATEKAKKQRCDAAARAEQSVSESGGCGDDGDTDYGCPSKFFILCLNAIQESSKESGGSPDGSLLACDWGVEFWKCCSSGSHIIDTSGPCASREQVAWLASTASDVITRRERQGDVVASPFLLFLVPTQEKAVQVRSICKSLKALGIHTVSLHPGAPLEHQVQGLKSCEPEFLVSTPERLLELVSARAVDISGISLLVLDGLKTFLDLGLIDKVSSIRASISANPQVVIFSDCDSDTSSMAKDLLRGPVSRLCQNDVITLCQNDVITSQSAFISQHVHFYLVEEERMEKLKQILTEMLDNEVSVPVKVLLISGTSRKYQTLTTSLVDEGYDVSKESSSFSVISGSRKVLRVSCADQESLRKGLDVKEFEMVIFVNFPTSIEDYVHVLRRMARRSITGVLHIFFCKGDAPLAQPLIKVLLQCGQAVPGVLQNL